MASKNSFGVGGSSVSNGFDLQITTDGGHMVKIRFRVPDTDEKSSRRFDWKTVLLFALTFGVAMASHSLWPKVLAFYVVLMGVEALTEASFKGWHWVEHQAAFWLEDNGECEFDSINPISTRCGSMIPISRALFIGAGVMVFYDYGVWALPFLVITAAGWLNVADHGMMLFRMPQPLRRLTSVIAYPATIIGFTVQRLLYMRKPTSEQRAWAKLWAKDSLPVIASFQEESPVVYVLIRDIRFSGNQW